MLAAFLALAPAPGLETIGQASGGQAAGLLPVGSVAGCSAAPLVLGVVVVAALGAWRGAVGHPKGWLQGTRMLRRWKKNKETRHNNKDTRNEDKNTRVSKRT